MPWGIKKNDTRGFATRQELEKEQRKMMGQMSGFKRTIQRLLVSLSAFISFPGISAQAENSIILESDGIYSPNQFPFVGSISCTVFNIVPAKYLPLDGSIYNYDDYPILGQLYGSSPGGTFQVHDFSNRSLFGEGVESLGQLFGSNTANLAHSHAISGISITSSGAHNHGIGTMTTASNGSHSHTGATGAGGNHNHGGVTGNNTTSASGLIAVGLTTYSPVSHSHSIANSGTHTHTIGADGNHNHTITGNTDTQGAHTHSLSGTLGSSLGVTDIRAARVIVRYLIRALP